MFGFKKIITNYYYFSFINKMGDIDKTSNFSAISSYKVREKTAANFIEIIKKTPKDYLFPGLKIAALNTIVLESFQIADNTEKRNLKEYLSKFSKLEGDIKYVQVEEQNYLDIQEVWFYRNKQKIIVNTSYDQISLEVFGVIPGQWYVGFLDKNIRYTITLKTPELSDIDGIFLEIHSKQEGCFKWEGVEANWIKLELEY